MGNRPSYTINSDKFLFNSENRRRYYVIHFQTSAEFI